MIRRALSLPAIATVALTVLSTSGVYGQGCDQWHVAQAVPPTTRLVAVAWADGKFWAFGDNAYESTTGAVWTALGSGPGFQFGQVRWTGTAFVALGNYGTLATSRDGLTWTQRVYAGDVPSTVLSDVTWNGSTYVAVGFYATESGGAYGRPIILVSSDLVNWTGVTLPTGRGDREALSGIVWTGTRFVAVGQTQTGGDVGNVVYLSNDGLSWVRLSGPGGANVAWNGRELVVVGGYASGSSSSPAVWRSADGLTWQSATLDQGYDLGGVIWDGSRFVAVRGAYPTSPILPPSLFVSQDGSTWQAQSLSVPDSLVGLAAFGGIDVAIGQHGIIVAADCSGANVVWVPVASHTSGLNNSQWRSDLGLLNTGGVTANVQVEFFGSSVMSTTTYVPPGVQSVLTDVVGQLGGSGSGAIAILSDQPLKVTTRTYNQVPSDASCYPDGTQGQAYPVVASGEGLGAGQSAYLAALTEDASHRCNIGLVNTGTAPATALVELYSGAGTKLADYPVALVVGQWAQATQPFLNVAGRTAMDRGYAKITVQSGSGVFAFASVIDNITNDPTLVTMQR